MKLKLQLCTVMIAILGLTIKAHAQDSPGQNIRLSVGFDIGKPIGSFSNTYKSDVGGSFQVEIPVAKQVFITMNGGYIRFSAKDNAVTPAIDGNQYRTTVASSINTIPVKVGLKVYPASFLYIQGEMGVTSLLNPNALHPDREALLTFAPQIGTTIPAGKSMVDIGVRFESMKNFYSTGANNNFIGLRLAYAWSCSKH